MKRKTVVRWLCLGAMSWSLAVQGQVLPSLGEASQEDLSPAMERRIGETILMEIRHSPAWLDDVEINSYLNRLGNRLAAQSDDARQSFYLSALKDPTLNAFAVPGGYIFVHTGLILAAESESELASVLSHEISHVTQHHLARLFGTQSQGQMASLAALAVAFLSARSNPDVAMGAVVAGQAAGIQHMLNYSRDFEREADRIGIALLERSGFDIRGMAAFFERLQKFGRLYDNKAPGYLRTHPLTTERLADMGNRIQSRPYRQVLDSLEFQLVRAKLRAQEGAARDAVTDFESQLKNRKYGGNEAVIRYGLAQSQLRAGNAAAAEREMAEVRRLKLTSPMIETLAAQLRLKQNDAGGAIKLLRAAQTRYPQDRAIAYGLVEALQAAGMAKEALTATSDDLLSYSTDYRMHALQAKSYAMLGKRLQQHRAQAESYAYEGKLEAAIEQLQLAQKSADGNFYEHSQVDARLREFKQRHEELTKQKKLE